ncbi:MAG: hypothetical protein ACP5OA_06975 [Candidatus Woesearchaeota archaeon]
MRFSLKFGPQVEIYRIVPQATSLKHGDNNDDLSDVKDSSSIYEKAKKQLTSIEECFKDIAIKLITDSMQSHYARKGIYFDKQQHVNILKDTPNITISLPGRNASIQIYKNFDDDMCPAVLLEYKSGSTFSSMFKPKYLNDLLKEYGATKVK